MKYEFDRVHSVRLGVASPTYAAESAVPAGVEVWRCGGLAELLSLPHALQMGMHTFF